MGFWGDYHTHSIYSHGKATVEEMVRSAKEKGLKAIAITDHGVTGFPKNLHPADVSRFLADVGKARKDFPDMTIIAGVESNLISMKGTLDLPDDSEEKLDLIICGYHRIRFPDNFKDFLHSWIPNALPTKLTRKQITKNTDAYLKAMEKYRISIISHPMREFRVDLKVLGEASKEFGTYIEFNSKSNKLDIEDVEVLMKTGCGLICDSDAHCIERVGDFSASDMLVQAGYDLSVFANYDKFPDLKLSTSKNALTGNN